MLGGRQGIVAVVVVVALAACASEGGSIDEVRSDTPRFTTDESRPDLEALLLRGLDVEEATGVSVTASDLGGVPLYENPDPRGPCGSPIGALPAASAGRAFSSESMTIAQLWFDTTDVEPYLDEVAGDLHPGCGGHTSRTNVGTQQEVAAPTPLELGDVGDRSIGWTTTITTGGETGHGGVVHTVVGEHTTVVQVFSASPVDADALGALARTAAERLGG